jgi:hypothetical protein
MQSQKLDIVELIETNPITKLSKNYQGKFLEKIQNTFTETEQRLFVSSLYNYLNYDSKKDFIIDMSDIWKWLGFSRKEHCKVVLEKHFTKDADYKISLFTNKVYEEKTAPQVGGVPRENVLKAATEVAVVPRENVLKAATEVAVVPRENALKGLGGEGKLKEKILMTINTFKKLCLKSNTKKADEIHDYFIKLEELTLETITEESIELKNQLQEKTQEIIQIQDERINDKKMEKHNTFLNLLKTKNCIYLIELSDKLIKIGSSYEIAKRKDKIQSVYGGDGIFLDVFECNQFRDVERNILNDSIIKENKFKDKLTTGHTSNEVVLLSNNFTYNQLVNIVEKHVNTLDFLTPSQILEKQKLDIIEFLINKGEKISDIINVFSTPLTLNIQEQINNEIQTQNVITPNIKIPRPNYGRAIQQIDPNNLTCIIKIYKNMETLMEENKYNTFSETGIRDAIKKNTIYKKYRWIIVDNDKDPNIVHNIQPTVISKKVASSVILELNNDKTKITRHFISINVASEELNINNHRVKKMILDKILYNNHFYIYLDDAFPELLEKYDNEIFQYVPRSAIKIKCIHPETKEEQIFPSLKHAREFAKVHHKTVHKAIKDKKLLNGFYWELV